MKAQKSDAYKRQQAIFLSSKTPRSKKQRQAYIGLPPWVTGADRSAGDAGRDRHTVLGIAALARSPSQTPTAVSIVLL